MPIYSRILKLLVMLHLLHFEGQKLEALHFSFAYLLSITLRYFSSFCVEHVLKVRSCTRFVCGESAGGYRRDGHGLLLEMLDKILNDTCSVLDLGNETSRSGGVLYTSNTCTSSNIIRISS